MSAGLAAQAGADDLREVVLELLGRHLGGSVSARHDPGVWASASASTPAGKASIPG
jgi:hypothetical protein